MPGGKFTNSNVWVTAFDLDPTDLTAQQDETFSLAAYAGQQLVAAFINGKVGAATNWSLTLQCADPIDGTTYKTIVDTNDNGFIAIALEAGDVYVCKTYGLNARLAEPLIIPPGARLLFETNGIDVDTTEIHVALFIVNSFGG
jgi:hypothetical protein